MKTPWKRIGAGLGGALAGALLGAVMGFVEAYVVLVACSDFLGFGDQDGLILIALAPFGAIHGAVIGLLRGLGLRNVLGWVPGALVGLGLWAPVFLWGGHHQSMVIMLAALLMPIWCGGIGAGLHACRKSKKEPQLVESQVDVVREYEQWKQKETDPRPGEPRHSSPSES
jgi:hypothetical protein